MKFATKSILLILFLCWTNIVHATHIVGGEITYVQDSTGTYTISLTIYRDCSPTSIGFPSSVYVEPIDAATGNYLTSWGVYLTPGSIISVPPTVNSNCVTGIPSFCVEKRTYTGTYTPSSSLTSGIVFEYGLCCRNYTINNITNPGNVGMMYKTITYPGGMNINNSTPVFTADPPTVVGAGAPTTINFSAYDADGDSLYYEWANALNNNGLSVPYVTGYSGTNPLPSSPSALVNGNTGIISANLTLNGQYVVSIFITEYRNGIPLSRIQRDYQFNIATFTTMEVVIDTLYQPIGCISPTGTAGVNILYGQAPYSYNWSSGDTSRVVSGLGPGTYTIQVEDALGCLDSVKVTLRSTDSLNAIISVSEPTCDISSDGQIIASVDSTGGPYSISLNNTISPAGVFTALDTGSFYLVIQDTNGYCIIDSILYLTAKNDWNNSIISSSSDPTCWDSNDGEILLGLTQSSHTYSWSNGASGTSISSLSAGDYSVTISDPSTGCSDTLAQTLFSPDTIFVSPIQKKDATCAGGNDGEFSLYISGGTGEFSYYLNGTSSANILNTPFGSGDSVVVTQLEPGAYFFTAIDSSGCEYSDSITIFGPVDWFNFWISSASNLLCHQDYSGSILFDSIGIINASYIWNDGATNLDRVQLDTGTYKLFITGGGGCMDTIVQTITQPNALTISPVLSPTSCLQVNDGAILLSATGGTGSYTYFVNSNYSNNGSFSNLSHGSYTIAVTDSLGCTIDSTVTITADTLWNNIALNNITHPTCFGDTNGSITLSGTTSGLNFLWNDGITSLNRSALPAGTYTLFISNSAGCMDSLSASLQQNPELLFSNITITGAACDHIDDATINAAVSGATAPYNYLLNSNYSNNGAFSNLSHGSYSLVVTDSSGLCSIDTVLSVPYDTLWNNITSTASPITCSYNNDAAIDIAGDTTGLNFLWNDGSNNLDRNNLGPGTYTLFISNSAGCMDSISTTISTPDSLYFSNITTTDASCLQVGDASLSFAFTGGQAPLSVTLNGTATNNFNFNTLTAGSYTIAVTDSLGCTIDSTVTITADTLWNNIALNNITHPTCFGDTNGSITLSGTTSGLNFLWNDGVTSLNRSALPAGNYTLFISNSAGCMDSLSASLQQNPELLFSNITITGASCLTATDGQIVLSVIGGTQPYVYSLFGNTNNNGNFSGLSTGNYNFIVVDSTGICSVDTSIFVPYDTDWYNITGGSASPVLCAGDNSGSISIVTDNGGPVNVPFYWIDDPNAPLNRNNLYPGTYTLVLDNGVGCSDSLFFTIDDTTPLLVSYSTSSEICFGDGLGSIQLSANGGASPYFYNWPNIPSLSGPNATAITSGTYYPTVTDQNGCKWRDTINLLGPDPILITIHAEAPLSCGSSDGIIDIAVEGGTPPYSLTLNGLAVSNYYSFANAGMNIILLEDANGCEQKDSVELFAINDQTLYIPNAFTPSGDGINESFEVKGDPACFTGVEFIITDRWGEVVFRTSTPFEEFWDGSYSNNTEIQHQAQFQYRFMSDQLIKTGTLIMLR